MKIFERLRSTITLGMAALVIAVTVAASVAPVLAQAPADIPSSRQVLVGGILFLTIRSSWGGLTPEQRATEVQLRINEALSIGPVQPTDITVAKVDGDWIVSLRGKRLYTADYDTAKLDQTPPQQLANQWAVFLQKTLPTLTYPTNPTASGTAAVSPTPAGQ
jgi:hypothetical protein